mmetsp:Transcript_7873/g.23250  ORF Transcript_7873/g.23250 Transcript_7873/m.23250 type:complete len:298 (+) Transcript_7873:4037-4930(+)
MLARSLPGTGEKGVSLTGAANDDLPDSGDGGASSVALCGGVFPSSVSAFAFSDESADPFGPTKGRISTSSSSRRCPFCSRSRSGDATTALHPCCSRCCSHRCSSCCSRCCSRRCSCSRSFCLCRSALSGFSPASASASTGDRDLDLDRAWGGAGDFPLSRPSSFGDLRGDGDLDLDLDLEASLGLLEGTNASAFTPYRCLLLFSSSTTISLSGKSDTSDVPSSYLIRIFFPDVDTSVTRPPYHLRRRRGFPSLPRLLDLVTKRTLTRNPAAIFLLCFPTGKLFIQAIISGPGGLVVC